MDRALKSAPKPNPSQAGQAGAVPQPETAPPTGSPHEAEDQEYTPPGGTVNHENGEFHWKNNQTMKDVAVEQLREVRGSNGTPYDRSEE
jgi:hypothetical protein